MANNYKIEVSYDGTNFYGFQKQLNHRTIQEELEKAITRLNSQIPVTIIASGRTDRKVHAFKQVCTFQTEKELNLYYFKHAVNLALPSDIRITEIIKVSENFHPRYQVKEKHYRYLINVGEYNVFECNYILQLNKELDITKMIAASEIFIGKMDFRTFTSATNKQDTIKEIFTINITRKNDIIVIDYYGSGFLRYMVRKLSMILIDVGLNRKNNKDIEKLLQLKDTSAYSKVAGGEGLYLVNVSYNKGDM